MEKKEIFCIDKSKVKDADAESASSVSTNQSESIVLYKTRWLVLAIFSLLSMANAVIWISLSSITTIVKEYYRVSFNQVNWLAMIFSVFYVFVILAAYCVNKYGLKFTILVGAVANAIGSSLRLIGSSRDGFIYVIAGNAFAGLAQAFILFVPPTLSATWFGERERGMASAIGMFMNMLGVAVGFLLGGTLVPSSDDYDGAVKEGLFKSLLAQAIFCTLLVVATVIFVQKMPSSPPSISQAMRIRQKKEKKTKKAAAKAAAKEVQLRSYIVYASKTFDSSSDVFEYNENTASNKFELSNDFETIGFAESFKRLAKDKNFHLITQTFGIYFGMYLAVNTLLNQMCSINFPGKEQEIGIMGFVSVIIGIGAILVSGWWIDRTHRYKLISTVTFFCCAATMLIFTVVLKHSGSFKATFATYCLFGFFTYPYMTVGLEHAAEVVYPISEGITSGILLLTANIYGIIFTYTLEYVIDEVGTDLAGYTMVGMYVIGQVLCMVTKGELKRLKADQTSLASADSVESHVNDGMDV